MEKEYTEVVDLTQESTESSCWGVISCKGIPRGQGWLQRFFPRYSQNKLVCLDLCHSLECIWSQGKSCSLVSSTPVTHGTLYSKGVPGDCSYTWVYIRAKIIVTSSWKLHDLSHTKHQTHDPGSLGWVCLVGWSVGLVWASWWAVPSIPSGIHPSLCLCLDGHAAEASRSCQLYWVTRSRDYPGPQPPGNTLRVQQSLSPWTVEGWLRLH